MVRPGVRVKLHLDDGVVTLEDEKGNQLLWSEEGVYKYKPNFRLTLETFGILVESMAVVAGFGFEPVDQTLLEYEIITRE